jgi:hypothetical protein
MVTAFYLPSSLENAKQLASVAENVGWNALLENHW